MAAWDVLLASGVPAGSVRPQPQAPLDAAAVRLAVAEIAGALDRGDQAWADALLAWLSAFRHHWPDRYAVVLGPTGDRAIADLETVAADSNRYLKLRRIAIDNLARVL
jgi:hypothetical protein